jgi:two-component system chemotaxis response regulator CheB
MEVKVAADGEPLRQGVAYLAPDDRHLVLADPMHIRLDRAPARGGFRPAATRLFASVAQEQGAAAIAVILTGMGRDGVDGLHALRAMGGRVVAQAEQGCVVFGMPRAVIEENLATEVLELDAIGPWLREAFLPT